MLPVQLVSRSAVMPVHVTLPESSEQVEANSDWVLSTTTYGEEFISSVRKGDVYAAQFHPEKSGAAGQ